LRAQRLAVDETAQLVTIGKFILFLQVRIATSVSPLITFDGDRRKFHCFGTDLAFQLGRCCLVLI